MNNEIELKVQAYLDSELTPGEARQIASLITNDPAARDLYNELKQTKEIVRKHEPVLRLQDSRDFYWSKIQREIGRTERAVRPSASPWWIRMMAPVAGAVALFAVLLSVSGPGSGNKPTLTASKVNTPSAPIHQGGIVSSEMSAITFRSEAEGVTVVWLSAEAPSKPPVGLWDWLD